MVKKNISFITLFAATAAIVAGVAFAGFDENPTSALADRRARTEAAVKATETLEKILAESQKTNELLAKLVESNNIIVK